MQTITYITLGRSRHLPLTRRRFGVESQTQTQCLVEPTCAQGPTSDRLTDEASDRESSDRDR